jgi:hypothetical protein
MNNYKELEVWKRSIKLAVKMYKLTRNFPWKKNSDWFPSLEGVQSLFHPILQKAPVENPIKSLSQFSKHCLWVTL